MQNEFFELVNGVKIPKLGLGTWMIENLDAPEAVVAAIDAGYRLIDTAEGYGNEVGVGRGIRDSGVAREKLFVTTKLEADFKTYAEAKAGIAKSLTDLDIGYIDLMLIHAPQPWKDFRGAEHYYKENLAVWRALEEAYHAGQIRAIGVSNFEQVDLQNLLDHATVKPMVNQVLAHIGNTPFELIDFCKQNDILVEAYSPVAHGEMLKNNAVAEMAAKYGVSTPQLCIRYCLELGLLPLPKTGNPLHMRSNLNINFTISDVDMAKLIHIDSMKDYGDASVFPVYGAERSNRMN